MCASTCSFLAQDVRNAFCSMINRNSKCAERQLGLIMCIKGCCGGLLCRSISIVLGVSNMCSQHTDENLHLL